MGSDHLCDIEFEKNRQEVLKMAQKASLNKIIQNDAYMNDSDFVSGDRKAIWEYEILEHRKKKGKESFMMFGAIAGIVSFIISVILILNQLYGFIG